MILAQAFRKKVFCFNILVQLFIYLFIYLYLDACLMCYKGTLAFIFEHIMVQDILYKKQLQNTRTDTRYFRYYPGIMLILIFPLKFWAKKCALYTAKYSK